MKPIVLHSRFIPFKGFVAITLLFFIVVRKVKRNGVWEKRTVSETLLRHETMHAWQQLCLFVTGLLAMLILAAFGVSSWWVWCLPILLPFGTYVLCWLLEIILPPYNKAYKDICFEGEANYNEHNKNIRFVPFSFLRFIPNKDWEKLGAERFIDSGV